MISTRGRYGIRVMLDLARQEPGRYVPLKDIAARQDISKKYLEIIVKDLVKADFICGISGKGGGYRLCRSPEDYSVGEILEQLEGTLSSVVCLAKDQNNCPRRDVCETLPLWLEFDQLVHNFFYSRKLSDLLEK